MDANGEFMAHVADACERAAKGDLEARVVGVPEDGDLNRIGSAINRPLDIPDAYVRESAAAMDHCSQILFHRPIIERGMLGACADAAGTINNAVVKMRGHTRELGLLEEQRADVANEIAEATTAVAAACEQLNATTGEIKTQLGHAVGMTHQAVDESDRSVEAIRQLDDAAHSIGSGIGLIARTRGTPTCSRSTPRSRPRERGRMAPGSPWSPTRSSCSRRTPRKPPRTSRAPSRRCSRRPST